MFVSHNNLKLLPPNTVRFWPVVIVFLHDLALGDDPTTLAKNSGGDIDLLANDGVVLVVGVVGVAELPVGSELELQELMAELMPQSSYSPVKGLYLYG